MDLGRVARVLRGARRVFSRVSDLVCLFFERGG